MQHAAYTATGRRPGGRRLTASIYLLLVYFWGSSIVMDVDQEYFCKRAKFPSFVCYPHPKLTNYKSACRIPVLKDCQICNLADKCWCR